MTVNEMLRLRWSWQGPIEVQDPGEGSFFELRVVELPEFFVAGKTREEVLAESGPALRTFLQSYLDAGETPPLPENREMTWVVRPPIGGVPKNLPKVRDPNEGILIG
jgi:predicted RNase H-like HicB family nuclease